MHDVPGSVVTNVTPPVRLNPPPTDTLGDRVRALKLPETTHSRSRPMLWIAMLAVCVVVGAGGWFGYQRYLQTTARAQPSTEKPAESSTPSAAPAVAASAPQNIPALPSPAAASEGNISLVSTGYIMTSRRILVSPKVIGMVVYLNAEEGRLVKQGEVLAKMESVEFQADYDLAVAALELAQQQLTELQNGNRPEDIAQSEAEVGEAEAQLAQLEADWKRKRDLRTSGILTPAELDSAEAQYRGTLKKVERLKAALKLMKIGPREEKIAAAKAEVRRRDAELVKAKWRLDNCTIKAPIDGTILKKNAEEGNIVDARMMNGSNTLCEMANLADIEAELMVQERDVSRVHVGQRCQVQAEAYRERIYEGVVSRLMPIAERSKGAIPVRVKITVPMDEIGVYLKPDMSARVTFLKD
ncbi:MAG: efflux RND transporter periplasmic adaptor subunit [Planctomycetes bacterium]|nr:efflux RND transporter periplasmic adaptor subunit [Planctomycetota bacterium]